jgi:hypothetical protein
MRARILHLAVIGLITAATSVHASVAQSDSTDRVTRVLLRINSPVQVSRDQVEHSIAVINSTATIDGTVLEQLFVINGTARVTGEMRGNVTIINGRIELAESARLGRDILLYRSTIARAPGAQVSGAVRDEGRISIASGSRWFLWGSVTLTLILAGLAFAFLAGPVLERAGSSLATSLSGTVVTAALLLVGLPIAAAFSVLTGIGIVLGFFILVFLIPSLAFLGYVVTGATIGRRLMRRATPAVPLLGTVALGLFVLQIAATLPVVGAVVFFIASPLGAGALLYSVWSGNRAGVASVVDSRESDLLEAGVG